MLCFISISCGIIILMNLQLSRTANFLNSDDYSCSCGCKITDTLGNMLEKMASSNCVPKLTIFYRNITFDCPCGCNGILPNKFSFIINPSPSKCSIQNLVKVLDKDLPDCKCGCVNFMLMSGFNISVNKDYVLKTNPTCTALPQTNNNNPFDFGQLFFPNQGTLQSNTNPFLSPQPNINLLPGQPNRPQFPQSSTNLLIPQQPSINSFQPPQSNVNLLQSPQSNTNLLSPQSNANLLQPPLSNINLPLPPQSNTNLLIPSQPNTNLVLPPQSNSNLPLAQSNNSEPNPQLTNLDLSLFGKVPG